MCGRGNEEARKSDVDMRANKIALHRAVEPVGVPERSVLSERDAAVV